MLHEIDIPQKFIEEYEDVIDIWYGYQRPGCYNKQFLHRHREDGPAFIRLRKDGKLLLEMWAANNQIHRIDGPAIIDYYPDGGNKNKEYYLFGNLILE